jgi:hypothetical protein
MIQLTILYFSLWNTSPEDGRKGPKHVGGLPHVCISLYAIRVLLLLHKWLFVLLRGTGMILNLKHGYFA